MEVVLLCGFTIMSFSWKEDAELQTAVEFVSQGLTLRGMLHMPDNAAGNVPVVIIFHGFTGNKMEPHFIFVKLSRMLEKKGIASVRFDFGGSGESDGEFKDMTLSGEIRDAQNILDYVKRLKGIDTGRIGVAGLSMGGAVASVLGGTRKDDIKGLCLLAPAGNMGELIMSGYTPEDKEMMDRFGYADLNGLALGSGFLEDVVKVDIYGMAKGFDKKVLILHGDKDPTVPISASEKYLGCYGGKAALRIIEGADHTFNSLKWEKEVLESTVEFMTRELNKDAVLE